MTNSSDKGSFKLTTPFALLFASGALTLLGTWYGATWFGHHLAIEETEYQAIVSAKRTIQSLENSQSAFTSSRLSDHDELLLDSLRKTTGIFEQKCLINKAGFSGHPKKQTSVKPKPGPFSKIRLCRATFMPSILR